MKFNYLARDSKGELQSGTIKAPDQETALKTIQGRDLIIVKLQAAQKMSLFAKNIGFFNRVKKKETFVFFRQLSILVEANIPLVQALRSLGQQVDNSYFEEIIFEIANNIDGGMALSQALSKYPKIFSSFSVNLIKSGEVSGRLQECLNYLSEYLEKEYYLLAKVRGAMIYPVFILGAFLIVGVLAMILVIPNLTSVLTESGQELPLPTKIIIAISDFIISYGWLILIILIIAGFSFVKYKNTEQGKARLDRIKLKIPIFGKILQKTYLAQLANNLSALTKGGVSVLQSLSIAAQVIDNAVFQQILFQAREKVRAGKNISSVLEEHEEFPPLFCQMIRTGESTGKLDILLEKLSNFYNKEVDNIVNNLSQLIEPVLLVVLGIGVGILILAVFMPIYSLTGSL